MLLFNTPVSGDVTVHEVDFEAFLIINASCLVLYELCFVLLITLRECPKMDPKAWWNIGVNMISFSFKTLAWIEIVLSYDPIKERELGPEKYDDLLWAQEAHWFLFDYFASYMLKMSIYVFIFEMRQVYDILTSESNEIYL